RAERKACYLRCVALQMFPGSPYGRSDMPDEIGSGGNLLIRDVLEFYCRSRHQRICCLFCSVSQIRKCIGGLALKVGLSVSLREIGRGAACNSTRTRAGCAAHLE